VVGGRGIVYGGESWECTLHNVHLHDAEASEKAQHDTYDMLQLSVSTC